MKWLNTFVQYSRTLISYSEEYTCEENVFRLFIASFKISIAFPINIEFCFFHFLFPFEKIYVHVPPPEAEEPAEIIARAPQPISHQKHYKIIFIKAPSPPSTKQIIQQQQQTEEKTLVYVLVKKPDSLEDIQQTIQAAPVNSAPNKPEVLSNIQSFPLFFRQNQKKINIGSHPQCSISHTGLLHQIQNTKRFIRCSSAISSSPNTFSIS